MSDTPNGGPYPRSAMEAGSPEFAEDRTQVNSLNNKYLFDSHLNLSLTAAQRSQVNFDNLQQVSLRALNASVDLQAQLNQKILSGFDQNAVEIAAINSQRMRFSDDANYVTRYDLSNPVTTGAGDTLRSAAYTPNRATDVASAGVGVSAEAVSASVANTLTVTLAPLMAILQQVVQALATATTSTANVVNQAQPKTAA